MLKYVRDCTHLIIYRVHLLLVHLLHTYYILHSYTSAVFNKKKKENDEWKNSKWRKKSDTNYFYWAIFRSTNMATLFLTTSTSQYNAFRSKFWEKGLTFYLWPQTHFLFIVVYDMYIPKTWGRLKKQDRIAQIIYVLDLYHLI